MSRLAGSIMLLGVGLGVCGCASHVASEARVQHRRDLTLSVCLPAARKAMAGFLVRATDSIAVNASTGNNAMPQCTFTARLPAHTVVRATANVDTAPQPYFVLERTTVEATQVFAPTGMPATPLVVTDLGLEATWFPADSELMSTDGVRLITVSVDWHRTDQTRERALAEALSRPYLRTPRGKRASALAKGAPAP